MPARSNRSVRFIFEGDNAAQYTGIALQLIGIWESSLQSPRWFRELPDGTTIDVREAGHAVTCTIKSDVYGHTRKAFCIRVKDELKYYLYFDDELNTFIRNYHLLDTKDSLLQYNINVDDNRFDMDVDLINYPEGVNWSFNTSANVSIPHPKQSRYPMVGARDGNITSNIYSHLYDYTNSHSEEYVDNSSLSRYITPFFPYHYTGTDDKTFTTVFGIYGRLLVEDEHNSIIALMFDTAVIPYTVQTNETLMSPSFKASVRMNGLSTEIKYADFPVLPIYDGLEEARNENFPEHVFEWLDFPSTYVLHEYGDTILLTGYRYEFREHPFGFAVDAIGPIWIEYTLEIKIVDSTDVENPDPVPSVSVLNQQVLNTYAWVEYPNTTDIEYTSVNVSGTKTYQGSSGARTCCYVNKPLTRTHSESISVTRDIHQLWDPWDTEYTLQIDRENIAEKYLTLTQFYSATREITGDTSYSFTATGHTTGDGDAIDGIVYNEVSTYDEETNRSHNWTDSWDSVGQIKLDNSAVLDNFKFESSITEELDYTGSNHTSIATTHEVSSLTTTAVLHADARYDVILYEEIILSRDLTHFGIIPLNGTATWEASGEIQLEIKLKLRLRGVVSTIKTFDFGTKEFTDLDPSDIHILSSAGMPYTGNAVPKKWDTTTEMPQAPACDSTAIPCQAGTQIDTLVLAPEFTGDSVIEDKYDHPVPFDQWTYCTESLAVLDDFASDGGLSQRVSFAALVNNPYQLFNTNFIGYLATPRHWNTITGISGTLFTTNAATCNADHSLFYIGPVAKNSSQQSFAGVNFPSETIIIFDGNEVKPDNVGNNFNIPNGLTATGVFIG